MKFWKFGLFTALVFFAAITIVFYSSCERNVCDEVTCFNGGSCSSGICLCPVGFEDPQCQTLAVKRYLGKYSGYTQCDNGGYTIDSILITQDPTVTFVDIAVKSLLPRTFRGYVTNSASTYSVKIADDSAKNYLKQYTLTLQGDKMIKFYTFETSKPPGGDTIVHKCFFSGSKQ
jgi:hypothetical protein